MRAAATAAVLFFAGANLGGASPLAPASTEPGLASKESGCRNGVGALCVAAARSYEAAGDLRAAASWYEAGCDRARDVTACAARAFLPGGEVYARKACGDTGPTSGCLSLAKAARQRAQLEAAERWYERACERGNSSGCIGRGDLLAEKRQFRSAVVWYDAACRISPPSCDFRDVKRRQFAAELRGKKRAQKALAARAAPGQPVDDRSSWRGFMPRETRDIVVAMGAALLVAALAFRYARHR